jgi:hypothetical protein
MATRSGLLHWRRRTPDWPVAAVCGFAAGAVLMVLDLVWSTAAGGDGPWRTSHMIASTFLGPESLQSSGYEFSLGAVAIALATHYALGIVFGLLIAAIMAPLDLDASMRRALITGAVFGLMLYLFNIDIVVRLFPWLAELRGWETLVAHLIFGIVAALLYWKLQRTPTATIVH